MPRLFGILNLTPDSFSDGGRFVDPAVALRHAEALVAGGADVIDVGAVASNPNAALVSVDEEIARLEPVLEALLGQGISVSVDTCQPEVQRFAIERGVQWINDIQGFADPSIHELLAKHGVGAVVMHSVHREARARSSAEHRVAFAEVAGFLSEQAGRLERAGVSRERILVDPGMGFFLGHDPNVSLSMLRALPRLAEETGYDVLISVSRKSFLRNLTGRDVAGAGAATLSAELYASAAGVAAIRTHDVAALRDGLVVWHALTTRT